jgi:hypothetical protein
LLTLIPVLQPETEPTLSPAAELAMQFLTLLTLIPMLRPETESPVDPAA